MLLNYEESFGYMSRGQILVNKLCYDLGINNAYYRITPTIDSFSCTLGYTSGVPTSEVVFGCEMPESQLKPEVIVKFLRGFADIIEEENKNGTN